MYVNLFIYVFFTLFLNCTIHVIISLFLQGLLPVNVLMQLKQGRQLIADEFDQVSIMLTGKNQLPSRKRGGGGGGKRKEKEGRGKIK
jgi:hypothetical protein